MSQTTQLRTRLSALDHAELTDLLRHRPDVLRPPLPRDLRELAERLWHPISLVSALRAANLAALQLAEAAAALGAGCGRASLVQLLADGGDETRHPTEVDQVIDDLVAAGVLLAQPAEDGAEEILLVPDAFAEIFPRPLDLGRPLSDLLVELPVAALQKIQTKLGLPRQSNRASTLSTLVPYLSDGDAVRTVVANAPRKVAEYLQEYAERGDGVILTAYDPVGYRARQEAVAWAAERGLMFSSHHYSWEAQMPAEVALALRGAGYRAPFTAQPPPLPARDVDRGQVDRGAAAALGQIADHSITVLDHVARVAVSEVKGGRDRRARAVQGGEGNRDRRDGDTAVGRGGRPRRAPRADRGDGRGDGRLRGVARRGTGRPSSASAVRVVGPRSGPHPHPRHGRQDAASAQEQPGLQRLPARTDEPDRHPR